MVRNTKQRDAVLEVMKDNYSHPTAHEIYELVRQKHKNISRGTVYRNLNLLAALKLIQKIVVPHGADHYDGRLDEHFHFQCLSCGKMYDVPKDVHLEITEVTEEMEKQGFFVQDHNLLFTGFCHCCEEAQKNK
ncbi:Fur family transcriptional regulator [Treponema pectinovorum]|uniref:Fur family transcriptional regulator n=1 Tax=Treponema pectinovorum TaxID=164 RepID=UPI0011C99EFF|nr:transcriptional repressor [Treponema pectinovorum]